MYHLGTIGFIEFVSYLGNDIYLPALPSIMSQFNLSESAGQMSIFIWLFSCTMFQLIFGFWLYNASKRKIIIFSYFLLGISGIINGLTTEYTVFLAMRFLQGISVAAIMTAGYASVYDRYGESEGSRLITLLSVVTIMAPTLGPPVGSLILTQYNWQQIFYLLGLLGFISSIMAYFFVPDTQEVQRPKKSSLKNNKLFFTMIFLASQMTFLLILWITESPIILMLINKISELDYGKIMSVIFVFYALGAFTVSQLLKRLSSMSIIIIGYVLILLASSIMYFAPNLTIELVGLAMLMIACPILSNRFTRLVIASKTGPITQALSIYSFCLGTAALVACMITTIYPIHSLKIFALISFASMILSISILVFVFNRYPKLRLIQ